VKRFVILIAVLLLIVLITVFYYRQKLPVSSIPEGKISLVTSIYPLSFFSKEIGGDNVSVTTVTPAGVEPHDFEPKPRDLTAVYNSEILVVNGLGLEPWANKIKDELVSKKIIVVSASDGVDVIEKDDQPDPHIWLDPVSAQRSVLNIRDGLIKVDPENEDIYRTNADNLIVKLVNLDNLYRKSLFDCKQDTVIASHSVFGYLEKRYRFHQDTLAGLSPDEEPSTQRVAQLINTIKHNNIKYILTETLLSPKLSETLSRETGAIIIPFNPLESLSPQESIKNEDYFTIQNDNIRTLATALQCTTTQTNR